MSLTPKELIKSFLTKYQSRSAIWLYKAWQKGTAQATVGYQNPDKCETLLRLNKSDETGPTTTGNFNREIRILKVQEQEYWFRVINDGMNSLDSFPYAREFESYKFWAEGIEEKAL